MPPKQSSSGAWSLRWLLAGTVVLLLSANATAHRQPECLTTITPVAGEARVEIEHRLHRHDAQRGFALLQQQPALNFEDLATRAAFALYLESQFALRPATAGAQPLALSLLGAELDGDYLLIYQEHAGELPATLAVRSDVLRSVLPRQTNLVHVRWPNRTERLTFSADAHWLQASKLNAP